NLDRHTVSPRLWRLLIDVGSNASPDSSAARWLDAVITDLSKNTLVLDDFLQDQVGEYGADVASVVARARGLVTAGLQRGDRTTSSYLTENQALLVPHALVREAESLMGARRYSDALDKLESARSLLEQVAYDPSGIFWLYIFSHQARCFESF